MKISNKKFQFFFLQIVISSLFTLFSYRAIAQEANVHNNMGMKHSYFGKHEQAMKYYSQAIKLNPNHAEAYNNRGLTESKLDYLGCYAKAILDFDKAIELKPNYATAYFNRGEAKLELGEYSTAVKDFEKVLEIQPDYEDAQNLHEVAQSYLKEYLEMIQEYDEAVKADANNADVYFDRGLANDACPAKAVLDYSKFIELEPNNSYAYFNRGLMQSILAKYPEAIADFNKAIALNSNFPKSYFYIGVIKYTLKEYAAAIPYFDKAIELDPEYAEAYSHRGVAKYNLGAYAESEIDIEKAEDISSPFDDPTALKHKFRNANAGFSSNSSLFDGDYIYEKLAPAYTYTPDTLTKAEGNTQITPTYSETILTTDEEADIEAARQEKEEVYERENETDPDFFAVLPKNEIINMEDLPIFLDQAVDAPTFSNQEVTESELLYVEIEEMPRFPGCENMIGSHEEKKRCADKKLSEFIGQNLFYPENAQRKKVQGLVVINFIVEMDGSISHARIVEDIGEGCGEEALRVINLMNKMTERWTPGRIEGETIRVEFNMPVRFRLE